MLPKSVDWIKDTVAAFDPVKCTVTCSQGTEVSCCSSGCITVLKIVIVYKCRVLNFYVAEVRVPGGRFGSSVKL